MMSNHYALVFGAHYNWLALIAISAAGASIRWYFVDRHKRHLRGGKTSPWPFVVGALILAATAAALGPRSAPTADLAGTPLTPQAQFAAVQSLVAQRCAPCHSSAPTQPGFPVAPKGILLDTPDNILAHTALMAPQVESRAMPIGNLTGMTDPERAQLLDWIRHGAPH